MNLFDKHDIAEHKADLADKKRLARRSDPETSREALRDIKLGSLRSVFLVRLKVLGEATANEVAQGNESLRKRYRELLDEKRIERSVKRKCRHTGKQAYTYRLKANVI